jgi:peptide/nickel transport system substrate-binding protein
VLSWCPARGWLVVASREVEDDDRTVSETSQRAVRTFVIADVRGYTAFTQANGDEAAARLAARFAELTRGCVVTAGGDLVELRGDEALAVFDSPRAALRCAVALQRRFADEMRLDASLPLRVGIGIDAGEAVAVEGGYRGGALNLAARLCSLAKPGDVLVSEGVVLLARRVEAVEYRDRGRVNLKGLREPVRYYRAEFELDLPVGEPAPGRRRYVKILLAVVAVVVAAAVASVVWVESGANPDSVVLAANGVGALDAHGRIVGQASISGPPGGVASGLGQIWVTDPAAGTVHVIDPVTAATAGTPVSTRGHDPTGIAVAAGKVWVVNSGDGRVAEFDPGTGTVVQQVAVGNGAQAIAADGTDVWVVNSADGTLQRIDARSGAVSAPIPVGAAPVGVATGAGAVWVTDAADGVLARVDAHTLQVTPIPVGQSPAGVAVGYGAVWVANTTDNTVTRLSLPDLQVRKIAVSAPTAVAAGAGGVWVASQGARRVVRIDPGSFQVTKTVATANPPGTMTVAGDRVWLTVLSAPVSHRGGTVRLGLAAGFDSIDPAVSFSPWSWQVLANTNDGLVGYRRVGGGAGSVIVPDLAVAIPTASDDGLSYTFQLRRGLRYSNGTPVEASDFRYALERSLRSQLSPASYFLTSIKGASHCPGTSVRCQLDAGVVTNNAAGTITIHLSHPDPELLPSLTLPFADLLPPGSPPAGTAAALPATGPYRVASYTPNHRLVLIRNRFFRQWSSQAQPAGFPDEITWSLDMPVREQIARVARGTLDAALGDPNGSRAGPNPTPLLRRYPDQTHEYTRVQVSAFFLNTQTAPFDHERVRQAVNYAIDRLEALRTIGGKASGRITCQLLPPNIPGYRSYCPYTENSGSATWTAPDLRRARRLASQSGTTGTLVTVHSPPEWGQRAQVLVSALRSIGYHARLVVVPSDKAYFPSIYNAHSRIQAGPYGWVGDYPAPSDFLQLQFSCHAAAALNVAHFCDPAIDREMERASLLQATDLPRANLLWEQIDRQLTNAAPWVPILNLSLSDFLSKRAGNYQPHPQWGMLVDQLWVR